MSLYLAVVFRQVILRSCPALAICEILSEETEIAILLDLQPGCFPGQANGNLAPPTFFADLNLPSKVNTLHIRISLTISYITCRLRLQRKDRCPPESTRRRLAAPT